MTDKTLYAAIIFVLTYLLITVQKIPGIKLDRPAGVSIGAILMVLAGVLTLDEAYAFIDLDTLAFLLGMMILIAYLGLSGFFELVASWIVRVSGNTSRMLLLVVFSSGILSALFVNDTICLLFTPIILAATKTVGVNPVPFLIAVATASNIGSVATVTGNPQNMFIGIRSGIPFLTFLAKMLPISLIGLFLNYAIIRLFYSKEINRKTISPNGIHKIKLNKLLLVKSLGVLIVVFLLFIYGIPYPFAALLGAALILLIGVIEPKLAFREVNWTLLLFFAGLFVVMGGVEKSGLSETLFEKTSYLFELNSWKGMSSTSAIVLILSNLVSNVPAVMLFAPHVSSSPNPENTWLVLAMASTLAGNFTLVGSVANLIVAEIAKEGGVKMGFWEYFKLGAPITVISILMGIFWLLYV
ncbi:MAG TPA: anion transporter [Thermodesulfobacteriota bacterium]|nr:anion transporter [Thermodesulfobacteriota bacterium]